MRKKLQRVITICMASAVLIGCQENDVQSQETKTVDVEVIMPSYDNISVDGSFIGTVETGDVISIYPKISAQVMEKYFEVGDYVNAGDLLFVLDDKALQIEKSNADASVQSAAAALDAQKANSTATQAAANETIGTIGTTEFERAKAINEADREATAARINENKSVQQANISSGDANRARDQINSANDQLVSAQNYYNHLNEIKNAYVRYEKEGNEEKAQECINRSSFLSYEELSSAVDTAKGVIDSAIAEKNAQEGNYSSSISQKLEASASAEIERGSLANAEEAKALAQKLFLDYEMFTKNTIIAEANAKVAEGQAGVAASDSLLKSAKAVQDLANLQLSYTNVTAPISGVIDEINIVQYGMAMDSDAAYVITGQNSKKICFGVPESTKQKIEVGQPVTIQKDDKEFTAVVTRVNDNLQQGSMLFKVETAIQDTEDVDFVVGTKFKVITSVDKKDNVLTIPISTLYYDDGKPYIYVAENNKAIRKDVKTGISDSSKIQIISGLEEKAQVITSWSSSLKDQTDINIVSNNKANNESVNDANVIKIEDDSNNQIPKVDISRKVETKKEEESGDVVIMVETTDKVNVRKEADKSSKKLYTAEKGTKFEKIADTDNGWSKIKYDGQEAYIKSDYLKVVQ